jgi:hypothetical protein
MFSFPIDSFVPSSSLGLWSYKVVLEQWKGEGLRTLLAVFIAGKLLKVTLNY